MGARLLVVGDVIDDIVVRPVRAIRRDADTDAEIANRPGGSAANAASWMAAAGGDVRFRGRVGAADVERHAAALRAAGVDAVLDGDEELPTGTIVLIVEGNHRTMLTQRGANARLSYDHVDDDELRAAAIVHATGYGLDGHADAYGRMVARAHAFDARVSLNPGSVGTVEDLGLPTMLAALDATDILIANLDEGRVLTGRYAPEEVAAALAERCPTIALTMGEHGSIVGTAGALERVPSQRTELVDPTGAGDSFGAGFLVGLAHGLAPAAAAEQGARLAARAVAQVGARPRGAA
ncbi:Sugar or nucleoside kinase, ribokinase family [Agrococcus baldri]|uniref:Sugar or nucleoside kinase, ribokinase family n=1 Tax=Agrococcus baldri TaxID=153730 RepID=A0AA94HLL1_9MICO|nr:PfkB family carbohydrate kinase [Agrococcus baldri]SFS07708.1 Sugar or nucleoside kinase, ribokinase family [Agrococcus baldri]